MWNYEKRLQYPVNISQKNPAMAQVIITQLGGPDGELAASMRYISQRYVMPYREVAGLLTDIGTEELAHLEIISAIVHQLTEGLSPEELKAAGAGEGDTQRAIQESIGVIFGKILGNAGVYKDTEEGREAFRRFCKSL